MSSMCLSVGISQLLTGQEYEKGASTRTPASGTPSYQLETALELNEMRVYQTAAADIGR